MLLKVGLIEGTSFSRRTFLLGNNVGAGNKLLVRDAGGVRFCQIDTHEHHAFFASGIRAIKSSERCVNLEEKVVKV